MQLPEPLQSSDVSIEQALRKRRSVREFRKRALTLAEVSQLLWSAQGITGPHGHAIDLVVEGDVRRELAVDAADQRWGTLWRTRVYRRSLSALVRA